MKRCTNACVRYPERLMPDPFLLAVLLTAVAVLVVFVVVPGRSRASSSTPDSAASGDRKDAVLQAERVALAAGRPTTTVADAVDALRAHTTAYQELTTPPAAPPVPPVPFPSREPSDRRATQR